VSEPEILVVANEDEASLRATELIARTLFDAVGERDGRADWATTGGSAPIGIYRAMEAPDIRARIPWGQVHTWWTDDRFVPSDHPLSNTRAFEDILLEAGAWESVHSDDPHHSVRIPAQNVHPFRTGEAIGVGEDAADCARDLADELRAAGLPEDDGWPVFDLMLLGVGGDGHILSVFPGSDAFESRAWAMAVPAPTHIEPHVERVTLNPAIVGVARRVVVVVSGADKAEAIGNVLEGDIDPKRWPAQLARRQGATWILDKAAAARLRR
jgi:6-phosphogluconolactonase